MRIATIVLLTAMGASPALAAQTTYDAFSSFSATVGGTGPFTYGTFDVATATFTSFAAGGGCNTPNVICQSASSVPEILPEALKSTIGAFQYLTASVPADALILHPGNAPAEANSVAVIFTAPRAGAYTFDGTASVSDTMPSGVNLYAYRSTGGSSLTDLGVLTSASPTFSATPTVTLARGDRVGLIIGNAGDYRNDSTAVNFSATVAGVPEAGTWGMMIAGITMVGVAKRRRRVAVAA